MILCHSCGALCEVQEKNIVRGARVSTHFPSPGPQICEHAEGGDGTEKYLDLKVIPFELRISGHTNFGTGMTNPASELSKYCLI